jgi:hypothetical protein
VHRTADGTKTIAVMTLVLQIGDAFWTGDPENNRRRIEKHGVAKSMPTRSGPSRASGHRLLGMLIASGIQRRQARCSADLAQQTAILAMLREVDV